MKILVTGGAGYIGSHVVKMLGDEGGHNIVVLDDLSTGVERAVLYGKLVVMDLADFKGVDNLLEIEKFDAVIHFAAKIVVPESVAHPLKYYMNNTVNTANLIKCCIKHNVPKFIFSSTAAVYGEPVTGVVNEDSPPSPINPYGTSKLMSEQILKDATIANPGFRFVILRYFNVAGADPDGKLGQNFSDATHLIKVACQTAIGKRESLSIFGTDYDTPDGTGIRDYIHVTDLSSAHISALEYLNDGGISEVFNCGYGEGTSVLQVIDSVKKVSDTNFKVTLAPRRAGDPAKLIADNRKILRTLNWKPLYNDLDIISQTAYEWEKRTYEPSFQKKSD
jgi:UDP-glucose 4-epimerase